MSTRDRLPLLALLWLATAAGAGLLFAWLLRPPAGEEGTRIVYRDREAGRGRSEDPGDGAGGDSRGTGRPDPGAPASRGDPRSEGAAAAGDSPPAPVAGPPPSLLVTVLDTDGEPAEWGTVYAVGAGEPGSDDDGGVFQAAVEGPEPVRLRLPLPGLYDVGYRDGNGVTLLTDVRVEPGDGNEAVIRPAPRTPVHVRIEGEWPPPGADQPQLAVDFWTEDEPRQVEFPGRGERGYAGGTAALTSSTGESSPLPRDRAYRFNVRVQEVRPFLESSERGARERPLLLDTLRFEATADGETVRPGETLVVRVVPRAVLVFTPLVGAGFREAEASKDGGNRFVLATVLREGEAVARVHVGTVLRPNPNWVEPSVLLRLEPGVYDVRWEGLGMRGGARAGIALAAGETVEVGVPLEYDPTAVPEPVEAEAVAVEDAGAGEPPREILVEGGPEGGGVFLLGEYREEEGSSGTFDTGIERVDGVASREAGEVRTWSVVGAVQPPFLATEFLPVPAAGPLRLPLRPAGLLCIVPAEVLPEELGAFRIRRADGHLIPLTGSLGREYQGVSREWSLDENYLFGPFPEGRITFEVRLGGLRLPDVRADVKAGRIEVVRVGR